MLQLQLNKLGLHKKLHFITKLIALSFIVHCLMMVLFFFFNLSKGRLVLNNIDLDNTAIVLMPLSRHVKQKVASVPQVLNPKRQQSTTIGRTLADKKPAAKALPKKPSPAKTLPKSKEIKKKKEVVSNVQPNKVANKEVVRQHVAQQKKVAPSRKNNAVSQSPKSSGSRQYVGRHDLDLLQHTQLVKETIRKSWIRPTGLGRNCEYKVLVRVNANGKGDIIEEVNSGALALDMSARNFILTFAFPKQLAQYEIEIVL